MSTSNLQRQTSRMLSDNFAKHIIRENSRPEWCLGDDYERLELDFYLPDLNVAIEVQGRQHYEYTPHFHSTYEAFKAQQRRDEAKIQRCIEYGIALIEIYDDLSLSESIGKIKELEQRFSESVPQSGAPDWINAWITKFHKDVVKTWNRRSACTTQEVAAKANSYRSTLLNMTNKYGMSLFQNADPSIPEAVFWHLQKMFHYVNHKRNQRKTLKKRQAVQS